MPTLGTFGAAAARGFGLTTAGRRVANIVISADTNNYVLSTSSVSGYKPGATDVILTINSGVAVSSTSTGSYALTVNNSWTTGDTITIVNNGIIIGRGGTGGQGGGTVASGGGVGVSAAGAGGNGGPALLVQRAVSINNASGRISGGGGGGGGGGSIGTMNYTNTNGSCGGGGVGFGPGGTTATGTNFFSPLGPNPGGNGTATAFGAGGAQIVFDGQDKFGRTVIARSGAGGNGGTFASSGSSGTTGTMSSFVGPIYGSAAGGGAGGAALVGNSNITWVSTGTINGAIS